MLIVNKLITTNIFIVSIRYDLLLTNHFFKKLAAYINVYNDEFKNYEKV